MRSRLGVCLLMIVVGGAGACGVRVFDGWRGAPVARSAVPAPADALWQRMQAELSALGFLIEELRPQDGLIQLAWITRPGDGRRYLACQTPGAVGSASLRPRIELVPTAAGSEIVISTEARATAGESCRSNGRFEQWLLERLQPAIAAAAAEAGGREAPEE